MKFCPNCGAQIADDAAFCPNCGANPNGQGNQNNMVFHPGNYGQVPRYDPYDHTSEFDPKDISDNKVFAMLPYLLSVAGIIIALLAADKSPYVMFHVRQVIKCTIVEVLVGLVTILLIWTIIVPILAGLFLTALSIIQIIMFFSICSGKAKEPYIIRSIQFLK